ncbi:MAG: FAD:protein FMN transferase [Halioglobus sp.]
MANNKIALRFRAFGLGCHVVVHHESAQQLVDSAQQEFQRLEGKFDAFIEDSVIGQINLQAGTGTYTELDAEARSLFSYADVIYRESMGLFDPSTTFLHHLYAGKKQPAHTSYELQESLSTVGWSELKIDDQGASLARGGMRIDLNDCVRAYAVDRVKKLLVKAGVAHALIDLDRDIATVGKQADGSNWLVGMRYPDSSRTAIERFKLNSKGYSIRGNFEHALMIDGERFGRALSPVDGQPIPGLLGVGVIADSCLTACSATNIARFKTESTALKWLNNLGLPWVAIDRNLDFHGPLMQRVKAVG